MSFALMAEANKQTPSFDAFMSAIAEEPVADRNTAAYSLVLEAEHCNLLGNLHGGCAATLLDVVTSHGLLKSMKDPVVSVSVNLSLQYLKGARVGTKVLISGTAVKSGKTLAFLTGSITNYADPTEVFVLCSHTKFLLRTPAEAALTSKL